MSLATSLPRFLFTSKLLRILPHLPDFVRLYWRLFKDRRVSPLAKGLLVLTLAYVIWPFDVIPDVLPFFGEIDDLGLVVSGLWMFIRLCPPEVVRERVQQIARRRGGANG